MNRATNETANAVTSVAGPSPPITKRREEETGSTSFGDSANHRRGYRQPQQHQCGDGLPTVHTCTAKKRSRADGPTDADDARRGNGDVRVKIPAADGVDNRVFGLGSFADGMTLAEAKAALEALSASVAAAEKAERKRKASVATQMAADDILDERLSMRHRLVHFNVGGQIFQIPLANLQCCEGSLFEVIKQSEEVATSSVDDGQTQRHGTSATAVAAAQTTKRGGGDDENFSSSKLLSGPDEAAGSSFTLERDANGAIFIDRDPDTFRIIMNYIRGYRGIPNLTLGLAHRLLADAEYYNLTELAIEMRHYVLGTIPSQAHQFTLPGPGVNLDRTRLRAVYNVCPLGDRLLLCGRHSVTFLVNRAEYVGLGVISDDCVSFDSEFHRTRNCCVYYMTGLTYTNFPFHKKEETSEKYGAGDTITVIIDMQNKVVEYRIRDSIRCYSCASAVRLRFAAVIKFDSEVTILDVNRRDDQNNTEVEIIQID